MEPDFSRQTAEPMTAREGSAWFRKAADSMTACGATWFQFSIDDADNPKISLIEGWRERPDPQPSPHFHLQLPKG